MQLSLAALLALPALALATPSLVARQSNDTCPVGSLQCCQSTYSVSPPSARTHRRRILTPISSSLRPFAPQSDSETGRAAIQLHKALYGATDSYSSNGSTGVGCNPLIIGSICDAEPNCCTAVSAPR